MNTNNYNLLRTFTLLVLAFLCSQALWAHFGSRGPFGGSVSVAMSYDSTVFIGTFNGGVYQSTNSRLVAWRAIPVGLRSGKITALAHNGTHLFAGTADAGVYIFDGFVGTDRHWNQLNKGLANLKVKSLLALDANTLLLGTEGGGLYKTTDKGANWTLVNNAGLNNQTVPALLKMGTKVVAATLEAGLFVSTDNGGTWTAFNDANTLNVAGTIALAYNATSDELAVINAKGLLVLGSASTVATPAFALVAGVPANTTLRSVSTSGSNWYLATDQGAYVLAANTWTKAGTGLSTNDVTVVLPFRTSLLAGTRKEGIFTSPVSALNWTARNTNFNNLETYAIEASGVAVVVTATERGVFVSRDLAASYVRANKGLTDSLNVTYLRFLGSKLYASTKNGGVFVSADTGKTWITLNIGLTNLNIKKLYASSKDIFLIDAGNGLYQYQSNTWVAIQNGLPANAVPTSLAFYGDKILLGTLGQGVFSKTETGTNWTAANNGLSNLNVTSVATQGSKLFVGTDGSGVFVADLDAATWTQTAPVSISHTVLMGRDGSKIQDLGVYYGYVFASYQGGLLATSDYGKTWIAGGNQFNLPSYTNVHKVSFVTTRVFVSTEFNCPYSNALSELPAVVTGVNDLNEALNASIRIFPNPSKGQFAIELQGFKAKIEGLRIYDQQGKLLQDIVNVNEFQNINTTGNLPAGIYFVHVRTNEGLGVKKLLIQ
jgi:photosystem II stability/assembly factor-like uncharacterized protein